MDPEIVLQQIEEVNKRPLCEDWATKVLYLCEHFWAAMRDSQLVDQMLNPRSVNEFALLLQKNECFQLARQVIPELRESGELTSPSRCHTFILQRTRPNRDSTHALLNRTQASFDSEAYRREKRIFQDEEAYRARLYLHHTEKLTSEEEEGIQRWLRECPAALRGLADEKQAQKDHQASRA